MASRGDSPHGLISPAPRKDLEELLGNLAAELQIPELAYACKEGAPKDAPNTDGAACARLIVFLGRKDPLGLHACLGRYRNLESFQQGARALKLLLTVQKDHGTPLTRTSPKRLQEPILTSFQSVNTSGTSVYTPFSSYAPSIQPSADTSFTTTTTDSEYEAKYEDDPAISAEGHYRPLPESVSQDTRSHTRDRLRNGTREILDPSSPSARLKQRQVHEFYRASKPLGAAFQQLQKPFFKSNDADDNAQGTSATSFCTTKAPLKRRKSASFEDKQPINTTTHFLEVDQPGKDKDVAKGSVLKQGTLTLEGDQKASKARKSEQGEPEQWQTRAIPNGGLFSDDLPESYSSAPLRVKYECLRYALHHKVSLPSFGELGPSVCEESRALYQRLDSVFGTNSAKENFDPLENQAWSAASPEAWRDEVALAAELLPQTRKDPAAFRLQLKPLRLRLKSNRFFRKFGSHRFLKLLIPTGKSCPEHLQRAHLEKRMHEWLETPGKKLLGCLWSVIFIKPGSATSKAMERFGEADGRQVILFAESGPGLKTITLDEALHWFIDFKLPGNRLLPACKAYSRLELGFSSTTPTLVFKPSQVYTVPNKVGNGQPQDMRFNDPAFNWNTSNDVEKYPEMNDGCDMISAAAAKLIWNILERPGPVPSAFQARIGPWKGIWFVAHDQHHGVVREDDVWIHVNKTQTKFERHVEDYEDLHYDPLRMSFDVVQWSHAPSASTLYNEYLPILEDRGVPRENCAEIVREWLATETMEVNTALSHSYRALEWIQSKRGILSTSAEGTEWCGSRRKTQPQMIQTLIQNGFDIKTFLYLTKLVLKMVQGYMTGVSNDLRITIPKSTSLIGIADPKACLAPDEISLVFSDSKLAGSPILQNIEALVSRHPALRASDIQKVRVVCKPELAHLADVVVFPVTGSFPLAGKLQGGDYDGDVFWVCWEPRLVESFRNAPAPTMSPNPAKFNIAVDKTKCGDLMSEGVFSRRFLGHNFRFQLQESLLGTCTNYHKKLRYHLNSLHDPLVQDLADIHDLLVDSSKNGYSFSQSAWSRLIRQNTRLRGMKPILYEQAAGMKLEDDVNYQITKKTGDIVDFLVFEVARMECRAMLKNVSEAAMRYTDSWDNDIGSLWKSVNAKYSREEDEDMQIILKDLESRLRQDSDFYEPWKRAIAQSKRWDHDPHITEDSKSKSWNNASRECRKRFRDVNPCLPNHQISRALTLKQAPCSTSMWEFIRASALFSHWHGKPDFLFAMAGEPICQLKKDFFNHSESVIAPILQRTKLRKNKRDNYDAEAIEMAVKHVLDSDAEDDFVTAVGGDEDVVEDPEIDAFLPDVPKCSPLHTTRDSQSTQYSWPLETHEQLMHLQEPPTELPLSEDKEMSQMSEQYSQALMIEE